MRHRTAGAILLAGSAAMAAAGAMLWGCRGREQPPSPKRATTAPAPTGRWAIFRGNPGMLGVARGELGDRLELAWTFATGSPVGSSPVAADGRVYFGSGDANVYCLDLASGAKRWTFRTGDSVDAPPTLSGGAVYVGSADGFLYSLDAATGRLRWKVETQDKIVGAANVLRDPATGQERIVVGSYDYNLYCLAPADGRVLWKYESENYINGGIAVAAGRTVFGGCDAVIHVVGPDGKAVRKIDAEAYIAATPAFDGRRVYVGNYEGALLCADTETGRIEWTFRREEPFVSSPAVGAERVVAGCRDYRVYCLDRRTGRELWQLPTKGEVDSSPVICGGRVVFGSGDGRLYVAALADGRKIWSYDLGDTISSSPAVVGSMVLIGCGNGKLYAFTSRR